MVPTVETTRSRSSHPTPDTQKEHPTYIVQLLCKSNHNLKMANI